MSVREVVEPFASPPALRRETYEFRSTWLASSLRALRQRELLASYRAQLPGKHHASILESVAGQWLPIEVALAHYAAIDGLHLPAATALAMGAETQGYAQSLVAQVAVRMSREVGVTPLTVLGQVRKLWDRTWRGGDVQLVRVGPKEAELEVVEWSVAASEYIHHSMRGVLEGVVAPFCTRAYVREIPAHGGPTSISFRIGWV